MCMSLHHTQPVYNWPPNSCIPDDVSLWCGSSGEQSLETSFHTCCRNYCRSKLAKESVRLTRLAPAGWWMIFFRTSCCSEISHPPRAEATWVSLPFLCLTFGFPKLASRNLPCWTNLKDACGCLPALHSLSRLYHSLPNFTTARTKIAHFTKVCSPFPFMLGHT